MKKGRFVLVLVIQITPIDCEKMKCLFWSYLYSLQIYESPLDKLRINKFVKNIFFHNGKSPDNSPSPYLHPSHQTTKGHWWTDWILKNRLMNISKVISSAGNALRYSKTFAFILKFFINNDKVSKKFRQ